MRRGGVQPIPGRALFRRGEEMGHFRHGSTIIVLATAGLELCGTLREGMTVRVGQPLLRYRERPRPADTAGAAADLSSDQCP
jgi:phosphatidylserine decarboxylase